MTFRRHLLSTSTLLLFLLAATPVTGQDLLAITSVTVIDVTNGAHLPEQTVLIESNSIVEVGPASEVVVPDGAEVIEGKGRYLIPGLWDMHAHSTAYVSGLLVAHGVTGVREMSGGPITAQRLREMASVGEPVPRFLIASNLIDGAPIFSPEANIAATPAQARSLVDSLAASGVDFLKVYDLLRPEVHAAILERAGAHGIAVAGHVPWQVDAARASELGQRSIEHMSGIGVGCAEEGAGQLAAVAEHLSAGDRDTALEAWKRSLARVPAVPDLARCRALAELFMANETWLVPTLVALRGNWFRDDAVLRNEPALKYVPARHRATWQPDSGFPWNTYTDEDWQNGRRGYRRDMELVGFMNEVGVSILAGSDAGMPFVVDGAGLHEELELLTQAGLTPLQALQAATIHPAQYLEATDSLGTVAPGKRADLVLLSANPLEDIRNTRTIEGVILDGWYLDREALNALLIEAEERAARSPFP